VVGLFPDSKVKNDAVVAGLVVAILSPRRGGKRAGSRLKQIGEGRESWCDRGRSITKDRFEPAQS
jgi:hypothetical protein